MRVLVSCKCRCLFSVLLNIRYSVRYEPRYCDWATSWTIYVANQDRPNECYFIRNAATYCVVHPASHSMGIWVLSRGKAAGEVC